MSSEHGHGHGHSPFLQHHYDDEQQQFDSGKLGIWLFLVTEVLFFSGLFCAYALWRANHPEIFDFAHKYLDTTWGAINTGVLLFSSLTAAWAVRCAQLGQKKGLVFNLAITIVCAFVFMGIKYVEYSHKFHDGLLWGEKFDPKVPPPHYEPPEFESPAPGLTYPRAETDAAKSSGLGVPGYPAMLGDPGPDKQATAGETSFYYPRNTSTFFSIYFCMTALHGIHVIAGIAVFIWLLIRAMKGHFGPKYFGPVDYGALYWHIVDLVWIYLFPLLYLIH